MNNRSKRKLKACHPDLVRVFEAVDEEWPGFVVAHGHRGKEKQNELYKAGHTQVKWPNSFHNTKPSLAVDAYPLTGEGNIDWSNTNEFHLFAGYVIGTAHTMGIRLVWGGDWDGDWNTRDQMFNDLGHFELVV